MQDSEIKIIYDYKRIMHVINLIHYEERISKIETNITVLHEKTDILNILLDNLKQLKEDFNSIIPHHIIKRGIINAAGNGLRFFAGTMDNIDRKEIQDHFNIIEKITDK